MKVVEFSYTTIVRAPLEEVWTFFATANNLVKLTKFPKVKIVSNPNTEAGSEIVMKLSFFGLVLTWISYIEKVEPPHLFVDRGKTLPFPLKQWTHEHRFLKKGSETIMIDRIKCDAFLPSFLIKIVLTKLFQDREKQLQTIFHA